jgi:3-oxoadipate enol-lactonase
MKTPIHHVALGQGPVKVLVLHDWHAGHSNYLPLFPYLDAERFHFVFAELRGYGGSRDLAGDFTLGEVLGDCLNLVDALGWSDFHVLGHSMTGMVAQMLAAKSRARIRSVIAVCPASIAGLAPDTATREFFASTTHDDARFMALIRYMSGGLDSSWERAKLEQSRASVNPVCRSAYLAMISVGGDVEAVRGVANPMLVVIGEHDRGLDEAAMRRTFLAWHPNAELLRIPNCGHYPMQECPPYFASVIQRFIARHA